MKVKAQCLCKSQQALKGLQRVLLGTETWHTLAFGISSGFTCRVCVRLCVPVVNLGLSQGNSGKLNYLH